MKFIDSIVPVIKTENALGTIAYLDYVQQETQEECSVIGLTTRTKAFEIPLRHVNSKMPRSLSHDLEAYGIDPTKEAISATINQIEIGIVKETVDTITNNATQIENKQTRWFNKLLERFGVKFHSYVKDENEIFVKLMIMSNMLATSTRRGGATFAIVSHPVGSMLMDSAKFTYVGINEIPHKFTGGIDLIGTIANIKVFRSNDFSKNEIVVGKCGSPDEPGFKAVMSEIKIETIQEVDDVVIKGGVRFKLVDLGDVSKFYLKDSFKIGEKPRWQQILKG